MLIRMTHADPNAFISTATTEKDEGGGVLIHIDNVDAAMSAGWVVNTLTETEAETETETETMGEEKPTVEVEQPKSTRRPLPKRPKI